MNALADFLEQVGNRSVFCCQRFMDNGNRVGMNGKIIAYDDRHIVIQGPKSMHSIHVEDIIEIEFTSEIEIVHDEAMG
jgi:hypothetical protein